MADAELRGELALERVDLGAHDEALAVADAGDRTEDRVAQRAVLRLEVEQRNGHRVVILPAGQPKRAALHVLGAVTGATSTARLHRRAGFAIGFAALDRFALVVLL